MGNTQIMGFQNINIKEQLSRLFYKAVLQYFCRLHSVQNLREEKTNVDDEHFHCTHCTVIANVNEHYKFLHILLIYGDCPFLLTFG